MKKQIKIGIVIYESCTSSMVTGFWDILTLANQLYSQEQARPLFLLELVAESKEPIHSFSGLTFTPHKIISSKCDFDLVYIPGFIGEADDVVGRQQNLITWLQQLCNSEGNTILTAACNGNFLLAASGALDNKKATTHWSVAKHLQNKYRSIAVEPEKILIDNGSTISAAGVTAYFNLSLHIIQRFSDAKLSLFCAKIFLVDSGRKIQTPYQIYQAPKRHGDEQIVMVQNWLEDNYKEKFSLTELADLAKLGKKTLTRRFKKATGENPQVYLQKLRIETAKRLLESKDITFNEVTWEVGYSDASAFHKAFKQETGLTPMSYREKFSLV